MVFTMVTSQAGEQLSSCESWGCDSNVAPDQRRSSQPYVWRLVPVLAAVDVSSDEKEDEVVVLFLSILGCGPFLSFFVRCCHGSDYWVSAVNPKPETLHAKP